MPNEPSSVLLDTNVLVRFSTLNDPLHASTVEVLARLAEGNTSIFICPQSMGEFRQVATRPAESNGLGWTSARTAIVMDALEHEFSLLSEPQVVYTIWRRIIENVEATGRANFDARIVAVAEANRIGAVLTYEAKAFARYGTASGVSILSPSDV